MTENYFPDEMTTIIIDSLFSWQSDTPFYSPATSNPNLWRAIVEQDQIGWKSFLNGFHSKQWRTSLQEEHLLVMRLQCSALLLMSKLIEKLWQLAHMLWKNRNNVLHNEGLSIHQHDLRKFNKAIEDEFACSIDTLPRSESAHLFKGTLESLTASPHWSKRLWITSVWTARDKFGAGYT